MLTFPPTRVRGVAWAVCALILVASSALVAARVRAQTDCNYGVGDECGGDQDCDGTAGLACVAGHCQPLCEDAATGAADPRACGIGEACVAGEGDGRTRSYCQAAPFEVDLNFLDQCVAQFLSEERPDLDGTLSCSSARRLEAMLDRNGDRRFSILDMDLCIAQFLERVPCDADTEHCPAPGQVFCREDGDCAGGLHCDHELMRCTRECGLLTTRGDNEAEALDRTCSGLFKTCDYTRGECVAVDPTQTLCAADRDCPSGAYCLLGYCAEQCYRSADCRDDWVCEERRCVPASSPESSSRDPRELSVVFASSQVTLGSAEREANLTFLIMDRETGAPVGNGRSAVVGYRLETSYGMREGCPAELGDLSPEERADCVVDDHERWLILREPFGTLSGERASTPVALDERAVGRLVPGSYEARVRAILSNGGTTTLTVRYDRPSLDGDYRGSVTVYMDRTEHRITTTDLSLRLRAEQNVVDWSTVLRDNHLGVDSDIVDITRGRLVRGYLEAQDTVLFSQTNAGQEALGTRIPLVGLLTDQRLRLLAVVDLPKGFCDAASSQCDPAHGVRNPFGRDVRRVLELVGPVDIEHHRFDGMYRETILGLAPHAVTLEGGFRLQQLRPDPSPLPREVTVPLLPESPTNVTFPEETALSVQLDELIRQQCTPAVLGDFTQENRLTSASFMAAVRQDRSRHRDTASFGGRVEQALESLGTGATAAARTLADVFRGSIQLCGPGVTAAGCIDAKELACRQLIHQRAITSGWVDGRLIPGEVEVGDHPPAFCGGPPEVELCAKAGATHPNLVAFQEHNRMFQELTQALYFAAGNAASDAFYRLYRDANAGALGESSAFAFKETKLEEALGRYAQAQELALSPAMTKVLFELPSYALDGLQAANRQLEELSNARLSSYMELVDLRRRLQQRADEVAEERRDFQHFLHVQYLEAVWLAALERTWEGEQFHYDGSAPRRLEDGTLLAAKLRPETNAFGLDVDRIFFENDDTTRQNWQYFQAEVEKRLRGNEAGVPNIYETRRTAIQEMQAALTSVTSFEQRMTLERHQVEASLDELCGVAEGLPEACMIPVSARAEASACVGSDCAAYQCDQSDGQRECSHVIQSFDTALSAAGEVACRADSRSLTIREGEAERPCVRGRVGALLQESVALKLQRGNVFRRFQTLLRQITRQQQLMALTQRLSGEAEALLRKQDGEMRALQQGMSGAEAVFNAAFNLASGLDCMVIAGLAGGTSCIGSVARATLQASAQAVRDAVTAELQQSMSSLERAKEIKLVSVSNAKELAAMQASLDTLLLDVENVTGEYQLLTQQLFNLEVQIQDAHATAQRTADRSAELVGQLVRHLVGLENGSMLVRNRMVEQMSREMDQLLVDLYKMTQAFVYQFNLIEEGPALRSELMQIVTLEDVERYLVRINELARSYCARGQYDCDARNNREILQVSLRTLLFPQLRDRIDPASGRLVTVGEQFHDLITSPTYLRRVPLGHGSMTQIQLPFAVWLDRLSRTECGHLLASGAQGEVGSVAVNVVGQRLGSGTVSPVRYRLKRGNTDMLRDCSAAPGEDATRKYLVGRDRRFSSTANQSASFTVTSTEFEACKNSTNVRGDACWRLFARDRSLASPDWTLILPNLDMPAAQGGQSWLLGADRTEGQRPLIEDIIIHFRYASRPVR